MTVDARIVSWQLRRAGLKGLKCTGVGRRVFVCEKVSGALSVERMWAVLEALQGKYNVARSPVSGHVEVTEL